jgi:hypothetical protein
MAERRDTDHDLDGRSDIDEGQAAFRSQFGENPSHIWVVARGIGGGGSNVQNDGEAVVSGWLASTGNHREYILGNTAHETVLIGLGAAQGTDGWVRASGIITAEPSDGFVDLYVQDNEDDEGLVPSTGTTYLSPAIRVRTTMGEDRDNPEHGEDNYVYVEVRNAGTKAPDNYRVYLYWADPGTNLRFDLDNPSRDDWYEEGIGTDGVAQNWIDASPFAIDRPTEIGPFIWCPPEPDDALWGEGHYCLFARVVCAEDPIMHEGDRDYENNVAQRNVTVADATEGGECSFPIDLGGGSEIDVDINPGQLVRDGGQVKFRIRTRLLRDADVQGLEEVERTPGGQIVTLECTDPTGAAIRGIYLRTGETSRAELRARMPDAADDGTVYPIRVSQSIDGRRVGAVTVVARMVGTPAFIGNWNSGELHLPNCQWVGRMAIRHKVPFNSIEAAHRRRYDNCAFCLGGSTR